MTINGNIYFSDQVLKDVADLAVFLNFVSFRFDLCIPSLCTRNDIQKVVGLSKFDEKHFI